MGFRKRLTPRLGFMRFSIALETLYSDLSIETGIRDEKIFINSMEV